MAVTAALLHDVVDDTSVDLSEVREQFGPRVADIIHFVSRLSDVNQLLRRQLRREVWPIETTCHLRRLSQRLFIALTCSDHANLSMHIFC